MDIKAEINRLSEFQAQRQVIALVKQEQVNRVNLAKQALIDEILTPEIRAQIKQIETDAMYQLTDIDAEFSDKLTALEPNITKLTDEIKAAVIAQGHTEKGDFLQAVFVKGRDKWNTEGLRGYAKDHAAVLDFYTPGEPSVSFRDVK